MRDVAELLKSTAESLALARSAFLLAANAAKEAGVELPADVAGATESDSGSAEEPEQAKTEEPETAKVEEPAEVKSQTADDELAIQAARRLVGAKTNENEGESA